MDREGFRNRLKQYKEAKGFDPQLKYWDWKQKYDSAPQPDNMPSQSQQDQPTVAPQPLDDRAHRWDNEHYVGPVNTVFDADRYRSWKEPAQKTFGKGRVKFTYKDFMKPADVKYMKFLQSIGRLGNTLKGASIFSEVVQNLFPSEEAELIEDLRVKMDKQNKWLTGQEDIPMYAEGGEVKGKSIPTQEEYIAEQIAAKRAAALDKSRNRTSVRVPMVPNDQSEEEWNKYINDLIESSEIALSRAMSNKNYKLAKSKQEALERYLEEKDKGYPKLAPGFNCMYNAGDCYGLNIPGNQTFAAKHKEKGFKRVDSFNMEFGDIVQAKHNGVPTHAMIFDSNDKNGKPLYNYAKGEYSGDFNQDYVKQGHFPMEEVPLVYRYVGTPADSTQWINDYKKIYGFADGGEVDQRQLILNRANKVSTNYSDAKDFTLDPFNYAVRKIAKTLTGRGGISNCTLSATGWIDPNNQYMSAKNIFDNPGSGYTEIDKAYALPGDLLIAKNPKEGSYHTMLIESFDGDDPVLRYSRGGHNTEKNLVTGRSLKEYHRLDNEQGGNHTEDHYFRYNFPNEYWLPEVIVTPKR